MDAHASDDNEQQRCAGGCCSCCCTYHDADEIDPPERSDACAECSCIGIPCLYYCSKNWRCTKPCVLAFIIGLLVVSMGLTALVLAWPLYVADPHSGDFESCESVQERLKSVNVKGSCLFARTKNRYCEAGKDNTQEEWWGAISSAWYCTCGLLVLWQTRHMGDAAINTIGGLQLLLGVGSFLFHFYAYQIFWILDVWPITLLILFLDHALAERLLNSSTQGFCRWLATVVTEVAFWTIFGLSYAYGLESTAPIDKQGHKVLKPFDATAQIGLVGSILLVLATEILVERKMARNYGRWDDRCVIVMRQFYLFPAVFRRNEKNAIEWCNPENMFRLVFSILIYTPIRLVWNSLLVLLSLLPCQSVIAAICNSVSKARGKTNKYGEQKQIRPYRFLAADPRHPRMRKLPVSRGCWVNVGYVLASQPDVARQAPEAFDELVSIKNRLDNLTGAQSRQCGGMQQGGFKSTLSMLEEAIAALEKSYHVSRSPLDEIKRIQEGLTSPRQAEADSISYHDVNVAVLASTRVVGDILSQLMNVYGLEDGFDIDRPLAPSDHQATSPWQLLQDLVVTNDKILTVSQHRVCDAALVNVVDALQQVLHAFYDTVKAQRPFYPSEHPNIQSAVKHSRDVATGRRQDMDEESAPVLVVALWVFGLAFLFRWLGIGYESRNKDPLIECEHIVYSFHGIWHILTATAFYMLSCFVAFHRGNQLHTEHGTYVWRLGYTLSFSLGWAQFRHVIPFVYREKIKPQQQPQPGPLPSRVQLAYV